MFNVGISTCWTAQWGQDVLNVGISGSTMAQWLRVLAAGLDSSLSH